jgi:hypothetical protein
MPYSTVSKTISLCLGVLVMIFALGYLVLAWTEPSANPPNNNVNAPINVGNVGQSKSGGVIINTGGAATGLVVDKGNVGIGTLSPSNKLEVMGAGNVVFNTSGNVGIGKTSPSQKLDVSGQIHASGDICTDAGGGKCLSTIGISTSTQVVAGALQGYVILTRLACGSTYRYIACEAISPGICSSSVSNPCGLGTETVYQGSCQPGYTFKYFGHKENPKGVSIDEIYTCIKN